MILGQIGHRARGATCAEGAVLAIDVGGTTIKAEVIGQDMVTRAGITVPTPPGVQLLETVVDAARLLLGRLDGGLEVRALGIGVPGIVDTKRGVITHAANLDLQDHAVVEPLRERLGWPVVLGHDVRLAAEAERRCGGLGELVDPLFVVIGTGIAAVSYVNGTVVRGASGQAGELGHVVVRPLGPLCGCRAVGCLEAVASGSAIARSYGALTGRRPAGAKEVADLLGRDPAADQVWEEAVSALADGLLMATRLLAPGAIVLGGGLAAAGSRLREPVLRNMRSRATVVKVPPLLTSSLGGRAGVVGAALIAWDEIGESPDD